MNKKQQEKIKENSQNNNSPLKITKITAGKVPSGDKFTPFEIKKFEGNQNPEGVKFLEDKISPEKKENSTKNSSKPTTEQSDSKSESITRGTTSKESLKKRAKKSAKTCCCKTWIFFSEYEYLFYIGKKRHLKKEDMAPLPEGIMSEEVKKIALDIWDQMDKKAETEEMEILDKFKGKEFLAKKAKNKKVKDVFTIIYTMIRPKMRNAIILKALENVIILALSFFLRTFVPEVKKSADKRNNTIIFASPLIAAILAFIRYILKEHSAKFVCQSGSMSGQTLRTLLFHKIVNSNLSFLRNADESIVTKIVLFDLDIILGYIGKLPDLFSFPIIFVLSNAMMVYFISFTTLITFAVFIVAWLILIFVTKKLSIENNKYKYFGSKRATVVSEIISKMKTMKSNSLEMFLQQRLSILRGRELATLKSVNNYRAVANFIMSLTPFFSILIILLLERNLRGVQLDVTTTFTIVSIIASLNKPLRRFVDILDRFYDYKEAKQGLNNLLFLIPNKPNHSKNDSTLKPGWIEAINCEAMLEIDASMKENLKKIFGENLNVEKELEKYTRKNQKKTSYVFRTSKTRIEEEKDDNQNDSFSTEETNTNYVEKKTLFKGVNITIFPKTKVGVVGTPGSGASEFLYTILGETYITQGLVKYRGKVVYQDEDDSSYLHNSTIRDNILMGDIMIQDRYQKVVECVGLNLKNFPGGDQLEVLKDASNLSASEKRKLLLARSLYVSGDIYILEDFFGHDDEKSERKLFKRMIDDMLKFKTVIVKTDSEVILDQMDKIIAFKQGSCKQFNSYQDYENYLNGIPLSSNVSKSKLSMSNRLSKLGFKNIGGMNTSNREVNLFDKSTLKNIKKKQNKNVLNTRNNNDKKKHELGEGYTILCSLIPGILRVVKKKDEGRQVKVWDESNVYEKHFGKIASSYLFLIGKFRILIQLLLFVISACLFVVIDIWTGTWSNDILGWSMNSYIVVYLTISVSFSLMVLLRDIIFHRAVINNAKHIQLMIVKSFLNINLEWMNLYPDTRVDFKLSYDVKKMDSNINIQIHAFIEALVYCFAAAIILNYIYFGLMFLTMIVIGVYLYYVMKTYFKTVHSLIPFIYENTAKMKKVMNQTINEAVQYRVLGTSKILENRFSGLTNEMQRALTHHAFYCERWIGVRLGWVYTFLIIVAYTIPILFVFVLKDFKTLSLLEIALAISWSLKFVGFFDTVIKSTMRIHKNVISYASVENFVKKVETEATHKRPIMADFEKLEHVVEMKNLDKSFGSRKVLSNINLKVKKFEKIAVMGSSGSGKHVLMDIIMQIYFRDMQGKPGEKKEGKSELIVLGINADKSNPRNIRHNIRYLNRLPITYSGTVRENIDPAYKYSNSKIYKVMDILNAGNILIDKAVREKAELLSKINDTKFEEDTKMDFYKKAHTTAAHLKERFKKEEFLNDLFKDKDDEEEKSPENPENIEFSFKKNTLPEKRLDTETSQRPLLTDNTGPNLETLPNGSSGTLKTSPINFKNNETNKTNLKRNFLNKELNEKIGEYPIRLRKLLKAIKVLLDKPKILIIDQKALDFDNDKDFGQMMKIFKENLKNTTFFVIMNSYEHILDFDRALVMNNGVLAEQGAIPSLLLDSESKFNYLVKKADLQVYKKLKEEVLEERPNMAEGVRTSVVTETPTMVSLFRKVNEHSILGEDRIFGEQIGEERRGQREQERQINRIRDFRVNDNMNRMKTIHSYCEKDNEGIDSEELERRFEKV